MLRPFESDWNLVRLSGTLHIEMSAGNSFDNGASGRPPARSVRSGVGGRLRRLGALLVIGVTSNVGAEPVLHEYIDLGAGDGLVEPQITRHGAPDGDREGDVPHAASALGREPAGGGEPAEATATPGAGQVPQPNEKYSIDRDTTRPEQVHYEDPFTPTVVPFKRAVVYDAVNREGDLFVAHPEVAAVKRWLRATPSDEHFHAALSLSLRKNQRTPIPSVAPGVRLVLAHAEPRVELRFGVDSAENWFVESNQDQQVALTLQVVADRRVFGSPFRDTDWSALGRTFLAPPAEVKAMAREVASVLGIADRARPHEVVSTLIGHFRSFRPSPRGPTGRGLGLYRELALMGRGVCRHRAYAFTVTALGLGLPARMAMNEAHAWVEVFDGELWHRIDLGGAAEQLESADGDRPRHVESHDPFAWPNPEESGQALAERRRREPATRPAAPGGSSSSNPSAPSAPVEPAPAEAPLDPEAELPDPTGLVDPDQPDQEMALAPDVLQAPPSAEQRGEVVLRTSAATAERGKGLFVSGTALIGGSTCRGARIDVSLGAADGTRLPLGTLVSDAEGQFQGHLVVPWNTALGKHPLLAVVSGTCGAP